MSNTPTPHISAKPGDFAKTASEVQSSAAKWRRLSAQAVLICAAIIALAVIALCAVLIPRATKTLRGIDAATEELNSVASTLNQVDFVGMSESISELTEQGKDTLSTALGDVEASLDSMQTALDNISKLDVDGLNQSIAHGAFAAQLFKHASCTFDTN